MPSRARGLRERVERYTPPEGGFLGNQQGRSASAEKVRKMSELLRLHQGQWHGVENSGRAGVGENEDDLPV